MMKFACHTCGDDLTFQRAHARMSTRHTRLYCDECFLAVGVKSAEAGTIDGIIDDGRPSLGWFLGAMALISAGLFWMY